MERASASWILPNRGFMSGEPLEQFINRMVKRQPIKRCSASMLRWRPIWHPERKSCFAQGIPGKRYAHPVRFLDIPAG